MPHLSICRHPSCRRSVTKGDGYCSEHKWSKEKREHYRKQNKPTYKYSYETSYQNRKWIKFRKKYLEDCNYCIICGDQSEVIDHIYPHKGDIDLFWDRGNMWPLCVKCHNTKTALFDMEGQTSTNDIKLISEKVRERRCL